MALHAYELIAYDQTNYLLSLGQLTYVVPHIHREIELAMVLRGDVLLRTGGESSIVHPGEFWLMNACQCHEMYSIAEDKKSLFMQLQVSPSFFRQYFQVIENIYVDRAVLNRENTPAELLRSLAAVLTETALDYFAEAPFFELRCAGGINRMFAALLEGLPHKLLDEEELRRNDLRMSRMQRITDYIEEHIGEKLLLTELAAREGLTLNYLSHFFKGNFGMPFQTYLRHRRCRRAANLLMETDGSPSEISMQCGFSALKYMNQGFLQMFGCKPADYRTQARRRPNEARPRHGERRNPFSGSKSWDETIAPHFSKSEALQILERLGRGEQPGDSIP